MKGPSADCAVGPRRLVNEARQAAKSTRVGAGQQELDAGFYGALQTSRGRHALAPKSSPAAAKHC